MGVVHDGDKDTMASADEMHSEFLLEVEVEAWKVTWVKLPCGES